jgi:hypothetical protein
MNTPLPAMLDPTQKCNLQYHVVFYMFYCGAIFGRRNRKAASIGLATGMQPISPQSYPQLL